MTRTQLTPRTGDIISHQYVIGNGAGFVAVPAAGATLGNATISVTPPVDAWWDVEGSIMFYKTDAAYHLGYGTLALTPADQDGQQYCYQGGTQNQGGPAMYGSRTPRKVFRLAANTAYTAWLNYSSSGGTWQVDTGPTRLWISGTLYAR